MWAFGDGFDCTASKMNCRLGPRKRVLSFGQGRKLSPRPAEVCLGFEVSGGPFGGFVSVR